MSIFESIKSKEIHVWIVSILLLLIIGGVFLYDKYYSLISYNYTLAVNTPDGKRENLEYGIRPSLSNHDFYKNVQTELIKNKTSFVEANLSTMKLRVYKDGEQVREVDILTKGKKGSWWETPAGLYKAEEKIPRHTSSFSPVITEWNIPFQGNFFIHGWPRYVSTGKPVTSSYSGGCIRLSDEDAQAVYELVSPGMPILVFEESASSTPYTYTTNLPPLEAEGYMAADLNNNFVFLKNNIESNVSFKLVSPFLAALVATDYMDIEKKVTAVKPSIPSDHPRFSIGQKYSVYDFLFPLLIESSTEATASLSRALGDNYFLRLENNKAQAIGMIHTHINDVYGAREESVTTTEDVFQLAKYLYNYRKFILDLSQNKVTSTSYGPSSFNNLKSPSRFTSDPEYIGGMKIKTTENKESAFALFNMTYGEAKAPIVIIVLDAENAEAGIGIIREHIRTSYVRTSLTSSN